ncbi:glycosyltransferase [Bacteroides sp. 44_46]|jgi:glycosyltransferase involved in cell wall biosynthesis|uniref:glycosyltransferase family 2 protein n=1 Tax=Bacteroides sp. 44_46 TaxID=1897052 RepID=UPI00095B7A12|nr:glycosyltransferase [Bacteroides sp. 44_46]OKY97820.1 MAG: amylovoran biosynthesis protein AmsE [Bacteroides sp. 44_46]
MRFSVLLSVYYKESYSAFCKSLDSIFTQTTCPDEVILVEDGPLGSDLNDIISEYSAKYPTLKIIPLPTNQGLGKALNEGLKHCSYDIVARMDTDDIAKPDRFEKQLAVFEKYLDIDVVGAWIDEFEDDISEVKSVRKLPELPDDIRQFAKRRNPINHPVVMFRKSAVLAAGGYQHFPLFEDYYLWIRMLMNGAKFYNIQESLLYFRFSPEMFRRRGGWRYVISELHFLQKMRQMHFISFSEFMQNLFVRFSIRLIPNSLRAIIYTKLIR